MARELLIYCDESDISGKHFANFYGGLLVESRHLPEVRERIDAKRMELRLNDEVKWQKISSAYAEKYISLMDELFELVEEEKLKLRVMFTQHYFSAIGLTHEQHENAFFLLYYQFVKHAFGLRYAGLPGAATRLRLLFDQLPDTLEKRLAFSGFLGGLNRWAGFRQAGIELAPDAIAEVDSKQHPLLQCIDVVLGAMQFRLNDKHKEKPPGSRTRGKRTIAKERVYKHILARIRRIYPGFNIGVSTGMRSDHANRWRDPYRHWLFVAENSKVRPEFSKQKKTPCALAGFPEPSQVELGRSRDKGSEVKLAQ